MIGFAPAGRGDSHRVAPRTPLGELGGGPPPLLRGFYEDNGRVCFWCTRQIRSSKAEQKAFVLLRAELRRT